MMDYNIKHNNMRIVKQCYVVSNVRADASIG